MLPGHGGDSLSFLMLSISIALARLLSVFFVLLLQQRRYRHVSPLQRRLSLISILCSLYTHPLRMQKQLLLVQILDRVSGGHTLELIIPNIGPRFIAIDIITLISIMALDVLYVSLSVGLVVRAYFLSSFSQLLVFI